MNTAVRLLSVDSPLSLLLLSYKALFDMQKQNTILYFFRNGVLREKYFNLL